MDIAALVLAKKEPKPPKFDEEKVPHLLINYALENFCLSFSTYSESSMSSLVHALVWIYAKIGGTTPRKRDADARIEVGKKGKPISWSKIKVLYRSTHSFSLRVQILRCSLMANQVQTAFTIRVKAYSTQLAPKNSNPQSQNTLMIPANEAKDNFVF